MDEHGVTITIRKLERDGAMYHLTGITTDGQELRLAIAWRALVHLIEDYDIRDGTTVRVSFFTDPDYGPLIDWIFEIVS